MTVQIPTGEPVSFMAGDTVAWEKSLDDYSPADGWVLSYAIAGPVLLPWNQAYAVASSSDWTITIPATATTVLKSGTYNWAAIVTLGTERHTVATGVFIVASDPATAAPGLSHAATMLPVIEAEIQARITGNGSAHDSYSINGRSLAKMKMSELEQLRDRYRIELWRERNPFADAPSRAVRFGPA